ncbi:MAG: energy-coupling factor transporter ATPase [Dethiobacteria bacterium]|jgi:energy-coupling factor transport system ATP-binding protein
MCAALLEVKNVSYKYLLGGEKKILALQNLSLRVNEGDYVALIGPNGSGKSTLARLLNALLLPTEGEVLVDGYSTSLEEYRWEIRRRVGMVFQNPDNQIVATTVEEDVAFGLENLGLEPDLIRRRVAESLELVGLQPFARHAPHLLSGGQKQRLAIAGVIGMRPRCLVLDEPTAMLDPQGRREVLETIKRLNREEGITLVHITHFMEEALDADTVLVMDKGQVVQSGSPVDIFGGEKDLDALGLEIPTIPRLVQILRAGGIEIPQSILTVDDLVAFLC